MTTNESIIQRMKDAAYERWQAESAERRRIEDVLRLITGDRIGEVVKLGNDYVVEVHSRGGDSTWTTVVGGERAHRRWYTQEEAVLHLIARRHGDRDGQAVAYAARVLNLPTADDDR